jgi:hypothetical protein
MTRRQSCDLILAYWDRAPARDIKHGHGTSPSARPYSLNSKTSPGWHFSALQTASNVENRIALAFPFFKTEMLAIVMPTFSASSVTLIFRLASMTSMLMMMAMQVP